VEKIINVSGNVVDPGAWKLPTLSNKPGFLPFKKAFVPSAS
jgi:hypothetical protein